MLNTITKQDMTACTLDYITALKGEAHWGIRTMSGGGEEISLLLKEMGVAHDKDKLAIERVKVFLRNGRFFFREILEKLEELEERLTN